MKKVLLLVWFVFLAILPAIGKFSASDVFIGMLGVGKQAPELVLQTGHNKVVTAVVFSPDGRWVASGSFDDTIKIWDFETGRELRSFIGHSGAVKALACSTDGKWLASGGNDGTVRIWEVESGREIRNLDIHEGSIEAVAFSPDGRRIASGGSGNTIFIYDTGTGKELAKLSDNVGSITALTFSPDGRLLASGSADRTVKIWDAEKGKQIRELKGHTEKIDVLRFNATGEMLASAGPDKTVRLWKTSSGREIASLKGHAGRITAINFIDDVQLMSVDTSHLIKFWNTSAKRETATIGKPASSDDESESAVFSTDGRFIAAGSGDGTVTLSDAKTGDKLRKLENHTSGSYGVAFSPDGHWLASAGFDNTLKLWDLQSGQSLPPLKGHTGYVTCVVFHPDNRRVVSGSIDKTIRIWDAQARSVDILYGHAGSISSIAVGPNGKLLVSGSADRTVGIWDLDTKRQTGSLKGHAGEVISVSISPDEQLIASASMDTTIKIWNVSTGNVIRTIEPGSGEIDAVAFSPDGKFIVSGGIDKMVRIWETATGQLVTVLAGHTAKVNSVSFSPDGKQILSASSDKTLRIWSIRDRREFRAFEGHAGTVFSAAFSFDGKWLASASDDGSIIVWKTADARRMATLISIKDTSDWLVVTGEGFFDGSPASWNQLSWRFETNTFNVKPVEVFFNEFYSPGLLADLFKDGNLPSDITISDKDRRQPELKLGIFEAATSTTVVDRDLRVTIDITQADAGAQDVRLFRNGSLVRVWPGDCMKGQKSSRLEATIPIVAGENRLTAYAFNADNVKSTDATLSIIGATSLARKGTAYILAIGVNKYANPEFDLKYATADAQDFSAELRGQQEKLGNYDHVEVVALNDQGAAKANILKALSDLSSRIRPEDSLTIYFAGHGTAQQNRFYLIPYDLGYAGARTPLSDDGLQTILTHSISDTEIERAVEGIDAGQMLLIIDACNSGQVLETVEKRRGPMNSKGLAQLAYEKGMYVLTAAQSYQAAKEAAKLGHGFLTYALVEEGLKTPAADKDPKDGQILMREWLDYATSQVPRMQLAEIKTRELRRENANTSTQESISEIQRPRVFYRRETEHVPFVVARP